MGKAKRWTVTYTKQIQQKRKKYQDGFLELQDSTNKVMLYDECDKLLECRLLKSDETVSSGETLTFNGYLVDIGDPEGDINPISDSNVDREHRNIARGPNGLNGSKFRSPLCDSKTNVKESKARHALSPSQKIIKEFKKRELLKYGSPKISPKTTKLNTSEWQVLYTTQVTQKAKKYHDGFLKLVVCGSSCRQVMLFDANKKLLDSKFLKKDDIIRPGESLAFDAHLVDIGENQGNHEPDPNDQSKKSSDAEEIRKMHCQQSSQHTHVTATKSEWLVLYSKRSTKKAKAYHDGFLKLEILGSRGRQAVLCDLNKTPIERRFLKKDEVIRPGESIYFDGHFVDVGDPKESHQYPINSDEKGTGDNFVQRKQIRYEQNGCLKANPIVVKAGETRSNAYLAKEPEVNSLSSGSDVTELCRMVPPIKPLRDTHQILSLLQNREASKSKITGNGPTIASAPSHNSCESLLDRESIEPMKSSSIMSSKDSAAASGGAILQFTDDVGSPHQTEPSNEPQTNTSEEVFDFPKSGAHSSCSVTSEGESDEELSRPTDMDDCPSFGLGF